jgi:hypothetical protein
MSAFHFTVFSSSNNNQTGADLDKTTSLIKKGQLTRDELLKASLAGTHIVENTPIKAYKKIECKCENSRSLFERLNPFSAKPKSFTLDCIADLEIPVGSVVVRPTEIVSNGSFVDLDDTSVSDKLRTSNYNVIDVNPIDPNKKNINVVSCYSKHTKSFLYTKGNSYAEKLDPTVSKRCTSGLHFFLNKKEAVDYQI